jgi:hypothetical protein
LGGLLDKLRQDVCQQLELALPSSAAPPDETDFPARR